MAPIRKKTDDSKCIKCKLSFNKVASTNKKIETAEDAKRFTQKIKKTIIVGDVLCKKCFVKYDCNEDKINKKNKEKEEDNDEGGSSKENDKSSKISSNSSTKNDSIDWQDLSTSSENSNDPDYQLSENEDSDDDAPIKAKRRKMLNLYCPLNKLDSNKCSDAKFYQSSYQTTLANLGSKSNEIIKSNISFSGSNLLHNNFSLDFESVKEVSSVVPKEKTSAVVSPKKVSTITIKPKRKISAMRTKDTVLPEVKIVRCFLCGETNVNLLVDVPPEARKQYFQKKFVVISETAKSCIKHFNSDKKTFVGEVVARIFVKPHLSNDSN